jgi:hypothetical protein
MGWFGSWNQQTDVSKMTNLARLAMAKITINPPFAKGGSLQRHSCELFRQTTALHRQYSVRTFCQT